MNSMHDFNENQLIWAKNQPSTTQTAQPTPTPIDLDHCVQCARAHPVFGPDKGKDLCGHTQFLLRNVPEKVGHTQFQKRDYLPAL